MTAWDLLSINFFLRESRFCAAPVSSLPASAPDVMWYFLPVSVRILSFGGTLWLMSLDPEKDKTDSLSTWKPLWSTSTMDNRALRLECFWSIKTRWFKEVFFRTALVGGCWHLGCFAHDDLVKSFVDISCGSSSPSYFSIPSSIDFKVA